MSTEAGIREVTVWKLDPSHTLVEFSAKHMVFTTVKGRFSGFDGTIRIDESDITRSSVDVTIDATTIDTRTEQRDNHLRSQDFLHVEAHPHITFKSTRIERLADDHLKVYGDLTIRGTTREVTLDTTINGRGKTPFGTTIIGFSAETSINRKDFGLNWNMALEAGGWLVGDTIKITIDAEAVLQA
ncbi:MAG: YceI family protein [Chloroflexi bacterium]|nr:YceI family protein [Chloroflexota bacterium]